MANSKAEIGKRIRSLRIKNNLTQAKFAESLNVSTNFISEIETGKKNISQETLFRLCESYHLSADYLLFGEETSSDCQKSLFELLSALPTEEIPIVINYLEATLKLRKLDQKNFL